jgi:broad specificity phosphatase PhoE/ribonuclease HI
MSVPQNLIIEADGGSRGNPGLAGSGAVVINADTGEILIEVARFIGVATNNVAEYLALKAGLEAAFSLTADARVLVRMDSKLVIEQMAGRWKIKHPDMIQLGAEVQAIARGKQIRWQWIPREENSRADALANKAMDEREDSTRIIAAEGAKAPVAEFNQNMPSSVRAPDRVTEELTTVILVRHGRTHLTESKRISGRGGENPGLSELGRKDAEAAAKAVQQIGLTGPWSFLSPVSAVVASPIRRTQETANIIANSLSLGVTTNDNIAEISFGDWDGFTNDEVAEKWPAEMADWRGSWTIAPPNGESLEDFDTRVQLGRREILEENRGKTVVVVSHVMPIRGFIKAALDANEAVYWRPQIAPCSITIIRFWGDQAAEVVTLNATSHL